MAIINISRQVAAHGDEIGAQVAKLLGFKFIKRTDIEKRIIELGFPESKMPKYDERKPGFFASLKRDRDSYYNLSQYALIEAALKDNVVIIGRGAFVLFKNVQNAFSVRLIADSETRVKRLMKEFNWTEKQAQMRITESDSNRDGFHKNFYNVDLDDVSNFTMVLNTSVMDDKACAHIISEYAKHNISKEDEKAGKKQVEEFFKAQTLVNKLMFDYKVKIEFLHAEIMKKTVTLFGVCDSAAVIQHAIQIAKEELPGYDVKTAVSIVQNFKSFQ
ncbi:MAG: cytidylate kinase-like family protein [Treponema sp.]|jgi:cytidylate kinase|nr:cytidylate kinase-like family protein [Treponema sp.]